VRYLEGSPGAGSDGATSDPWVEAARLLVVLDVGSWPAGSRPHAYREHTFIAPSLDLYAAFTGLASGSEWLLLDAHSPVAASGLLSWTGRVWSRDRRLVASGGGQAVFRRM
jgi:acyl-CoA thioesterase